MYLLFPKTFVILAQMLSIMNNRKLLLVCFILLVRFIPAQGQNNCEQTTALILEQLPSVLVRNDFKALHTLLNNFESNCGETELVLRLQILEKLIQKEVTAPLIDRYLSQRFDSKLVDRYDYAAQKNFVSLFRKNKTKFDFIPLRHSVDSLTQVKANALLNSSTYSLNRQEEAICLLFADEINLFYTTLNKIPKPRPFIDKIQERESGKRKTAAVLYSGAFVPLTNNPYQKSSPTFGFTIMSPLYRQFIFEMGLKMRINSGNEVFDFIDEGQIKEIKSNSSYFFGMSIGYKVLDHGPWIILPKIGTGLGFINTKLSRTSVYDVITDEGESLSGIQYNNVNTLHSSTGIAIMRHVHKKMYVGMEVNYHLIPYNWDEDLITRMGNKFGSIELFLRF
jgi:hypothetical protein